MMKNTPQCALLLLGLLIGYAVAATPSDQTIEDPSDSTCWHSKCSLRASNIVENTCILPLYPVKARKIEPLSKTTNTKRYSGRQSFDLSLFHIFYSTDVPEEAKTAVEYACAIWETHLSSSVPIKISMGWEKYEDDKVIGTAEPRHYVTREADSALPEHLEVAVISDRINRKDFRSGQMDLHVNINSTYTHQFYMGTDGNCPDDQYDLVTLLLHEIAHGLGFLAKAAVFGPPSSQFGAVGLSKVEWTLFDYYLVDSQGHALVDSVYYDNPSRAMCRALTSNEVYFGGLLARYANSGNAPRIDAPFPFSGVSHLDEKTYPAGTPNALMTPDLGLAEVIHNPGPILVGMLMDLGWDHLWILHKDQKDTENLLGPITIEALILSDSGIVKPPTLFYKKTNQKAFASLTMVQVPDTERYTADILLTGEPVSYSYYIKVEGTAERTFRSPVGDASSLFTVKVGSDTIPPTIIHTPKDFIFSNRPILQIPYIANDNLGLLRTEVQIWYDDQLVSTFQNTANGETEFVVELELPELSSFKNLRYRILAYDNSSNQNIASLPQEDRCRLPIIGVFPAKSTYTNDFENGLSDWYLDGFSISHPERLTSNSLGTQHPYSYNDQSQINTYAYLRQLIEIVKNTALSFDEIVLIEPGKSGNAYGDVNFLDYVVVEASKDGGITWFAIIDGWDSTAHESWNALYAAEINEDNISQAVPEQSHFTRREFLLTQHSDISEGDTLLIRFRLQSDWDGIGWGWAIDNLMIAPNP